MMRSMKWIVVTGCWMVMGLCPAEAKDHSIAKSLSYSRLSLQASSIRSCVDKDVVGTWKLVRFDSSYRFKNPRAPYLYHNQVFQYSSQGAAKSAHSLGPISGDPDSVLATVPSEMTYHVGPKGRFFVGMRNKKGPAETWRCEIVTKSPLAVEQKNAWKPGDMVMTLIGSEGQPLFVRHLRKHA